MKKAPKPAPAPKPAETETNEQPRSVFLEEVGPKKIEVIKAVREVTGYDLQKAKNLVDQAATGEPTAIIEGATKDEAEAIRKKFTDAGATVSVDYVTTQEPTPPAAKPETEPEAEPLPRWATETPDEPDYSLTMYDDGGSSKENIDLTREEYTGLKSFLACLRYPGRTDEISPHRGSYEAYNQRQRTSKPAA